MRAPDAPPPAAPTIITDAQRDALSAAYGNLIDAINIKMKLTVTLTTDMALAIQSFANLNFAGKPLAVTDVLRAYLLTKDATLAGQDGGGAAPGEALLNR
jgi:hypothetical protein